MPEVVFDRLTEGDVPAAFALSASVGWNQSEADWRRLIERNPEGTVAIRSGSALVATATLATYGSALHWVGMVIVDPDHQGRGLGTAVLERVLERSRTLGAASLGLDATPQGEPLYRKHGFVPVRPLARWVGVLQPTEGARAAVVPQEAQWRQLLELDRRACGVDRAPLLTSLRAEPAVRVWVAVDGDAVRGFAFLRPGRRHGHLGPLVAAGGEHVGALLARAADALGGASVLLDAPHEPRFADTLQRAGLRVQRRLTRMTHGRAEAALMGDAVRLATSLEWG